MNSVVDIIDRDITEFINYITKSPFHSLNSLVVILEMELNRIDIMINRIRNVLIEGHTDNSLKRVDLLINLGICRGKVIDRLHLVEEYTRQKGVKF